MESLLQVQSSRLPSYLAQGELDMRESLPEGLVHVLLEV